MTSDSVRSGTSWAQRRTTALTALLAAAALVWTAVALSVHSTAASALDTDSATNDALARLGAGAMATLAATAAALWWRHRATAHRPHSTGGWARGAFALSVVHSLCLVPVITLAPWGWKAPAIALTCTVIAGGVREAARVTTPAGRAASPASA